MLDRDGIDLADLQETATEAAQRGREMASADALNGIALSSIVVVVADETWSPTWEIPVDDGGAD